MGIGDIIVTRPRLARGEKRVSMSLKNFFSVGVLLFCLCSEGCFLF
jgi:hypothetical protein